MNQDDKSKLWRLLYELRSELPEDDKTYQDIQNVMSYVNEQIILDENGAG